MKRVLMFSAALLATVLYLVPNDASAPGRGGGEVGLVVEAGAAALEAEVVLRAAALAVAGAAVAGSARRGFTVASGLR